MPRALGRRPRVATFFLSGCSTYAPARHPYHVTRLDDGCQYSPHSSIPGGKSAVARRTVHGADNVIRFLVGVTTKTPPSRADLTYVNGLPAIRLMSNGVERISGSTSTPG